MRRALTKGDLFDGCALAESAAGRTIDTDAGPRSYNQRYWNPIDSDFAGCKTACCIHGFAHIAAFRADADGEPWALDYQDAPEAARVLLYETTTTPRMLRLVLEAPDGETPEQMASRAILTRYTPREVLGALVGGDAGETPIGDAAWVAWHAGYDRYDLEQAANDLWGSGDTVAASLDGRTDH